jgi:hypothetical protein
MGSDNDGRDGMDAPLIDGSVGSVGSRGMLSPKDGAPGIGIDTLGCGGGSGTPGMLGADGIRGTDGTLRPKDGGPGIGSDGVGSDGVGRGTLQLMTTPSRRETGRKAAREEPRPADWSEALGQW